MNTENCDLTRWIKFENYTDLTHSYVNVELLVGNYSMYLLTIENMMKWINLKENIVFVLQDSYY